MEVRQFPIDVRFVVHVRATHPPKMTAECPEAGLEKKEYEDHRQMQDDVLMFFSNLHRDHLAKLGFSITVSFEYGSPRVDGIGRP